MFWVDSDYPTSFIYPSFDPCRMSLTCSSYLWFVSLSGTIRLLVLLTSAMLLSVNENDWKWAADVLRAAERDCAQISPLSAAFPDMDVYDGYQIQLLNVRERVSEGHVIRGHKVGLTSVAMQQMLGVGEPDYGHLLDDMFVFEDNPVAVSQFVRTSNRMRGPLVLDGPLPNKGCNAADVLRMTRYVMPAIEIIDSRISNWEIDLPDTIADNASSARVVLGGQATSVDDIDLRSLTGTLIRNDEVIATGESSAVLGNPVTAVAWLANKVQEFGVTLDTGHVILSGSCTRAFDVTAGDLIRAEFDILGGVSVQFT